MGKLFSYYKKKERNNFLISHSIFKKNLKKEIKKRI